MLQISNTQNWEDCHLSRITHIQTHLVKTKWSIIGDTFNVKRCPPTGECICIDLHDNLLFLKTAKHNYRWFNWWDVFYLLQPFQLFSFMVTLIAKKPWCSSDNTCPACNILTFFFADSNFTQLQSINRTLALVPFHIHVLSYIYWYVITYYNWYIFFFAPWRLLRPLSCFCKYPT